MAIPIWIKRQNHFIKELASLNLTVEKFQIKKIDVHSVSQNHWQSESNLTDQ